MEKYPSGLRSTAIFHELELGVWKSVEEDHSKDVIKTHVAGGGHVKDSGEGAAMVEEGVSEGGECSCLFDGEELVEGALRDGEAACARVTLFGDTVHREGVIVVGLFRERRDEKMADFSFFVAAESFKLVVSLDSTVEIKKTRRIERCQVS